MRLTKKIIAQIEKKIGNVGITDEDTYWDIYVDNPYCEDFHLEINKGKEEIDDIINACDNFDPEEHAAMWYGANRGEPSSLRTLLDNSDNIANTLDELATFLRYDI
jgi:hypothetical protein